MKGAQTYLGTLIVEECCNCGVAFGITAEFRNRRLDDRKDFHCPNGHGQHYRGKSEAAQLRDELARERHLREQAQAERLDLDSRMSPEVRRATAEAARYRDNPRLLSAFWKGFEWRGCDALPSDCPYQTGKGGYRAAWIAGAGIEELEP